MKILLINHYAGSPLHGMEFRPYYMARQWTRLGHQVRIVAGSFSHIRSVQPDNFKGRLKVEYLDGIEYWWYRTSKYRRNGFGRLLSIIDFLVNLRRDAERIAIEFKPDLVISSSTYPMDIWPARRIAKKANAKLVYEVHDLWPLSPIELAGMSKWNPFILWAQAAEDYAYRYADKVVSLLPKALEHMREHGLEPTKFIYVPNGVCEEEWKDPLPLSSEVSEAVRKIRSIGQPIVGYVGTHGLANALDTLLDAAPLLKGHAQILLVGPGPERDKLLKRVREERLSNVTMLSAIPKRQVPSLLQEIDVAYIGWHDNPLYRFGIAPNKLLDYMMAGRPIVHSVNAGNDLVGEAGCGITVAPGSADSVAKAILELTARPLQELSVLGNNGKKFVIQNHLYSTLAQRFIDGVGFS